MSSHYSSEDRKSFPWQLNDTTKADFLSRTVCTEEHTTNTTRNQKWSLKPALFGLYGPGIDKMTILDPDRSSRRPQSTFQPTGHFKTEGKKDPSLDCGSWLRLNRSWYGSWTRSPVKTIQRQVFQLTLLFVSIHNNAKYSLASWNQQLIHYIPSL